MLPQDDLRRRLRAAMALAGVPSWEALADLTGYSRSTVKDLGTERAEITDRHISVIAPKLGVTSAWFRIPDLAAAATAAEDEPSLGERVEALEAQQKASRLRANEDAAVIADLRRTVDVLLSGLGRDPAEELQREMEEAVRQARQRIADSAQDALGQHLEDQAS